MKKISKRKNLHHFFVYNIQNHRLVRNGDWTHILGQSKNFSLIIFATVCLNGFVSPFRAEIVVLTPKL